MARPKKTEVKFEGLYPQGVHFGIIQLERDLLPKPAAQRIVQWVNRNGELKCYVSENAYHRAELIDIFDKLYRLSYQQSISKGSPCLYPVKGRIHWTFFTESFCKGGDSARINPETDAAEVDLDVN
jgi:hypothetical protein